MKRMRWMDVSGRPARAAGAGGTSITMKLKAIFKLARPEHWIKNGIVLVPVIFAQRMDDSRAWLLAVLAAAAFSLVAGGIYVVNDICDRRRDRLHPAKKDRPLAAGRIGVPAAAIEAVVLAAGGLVLALAVGRALVAVLAAYLLLQLAYSLFLKRKIIVDVICIALGFVLRAVAGAVAIRVEISPWLIVCTFTICLFIGFCKRCNELATLGGPAKAENHRSTLLGYTSNLLTHLITLSAAVAVVSFLQYASSTRTLGHLKTIGMVYTLPLVIYAVCRFAMLSMRGRYSDPMDIVLHDWPMQMTAVAWVAAVLLVIRWGPAVTSWLQAQP